jgi:hypothetical protein
MYWICIDPLAEDATMRAGKGFYLYPARSFDPLSDVLSHSRALKAF